MLPVLSKFLLKTIRDSSWVTYCFYLTQARTHVCLPPVPSVAPNCCDLDSFLHICVSLMLTTSARLIFQTEPILLQAVYRYICVNTCTNITERLQGFFLIGLLCLDKKVTVSFYSSLGRFLQDAFR